MSLIILRCSDSGYWYYRSNVGILTVVGETTTEYFVIYRDEVKRVDKRDVLLLA